MKTHEVDFRKISKISRGHGSRISGLNVLNRFLTVAVDGVDIGRSTSAGFRWQVSLRTRNPAKPRPSANTPLPDIDCPVRSISCHTATHRLAVIRVHTSRQPSGRWQ
ncbi:unnamed protein product [Macrosiphum euphorbiae]|uniref:Uncharacterized protein n=1 Tax=Macrosiphum euphorbiae TaxID=13131 RepID=A0AAV0WU05_9HEMI|nr:unnamed protein product [Macrosiphum euphorbiae]